MNAATINLTIQKGAGLGFEEPFRFRHGKPSQPMDFTGCTAQLHVRAKTSADPLLLDLTTENGGIVLGGADGIVTIVLTEEQVAAIAWSNARYHLVIFFSDGPGRSFMRGSMTALPEF